MILHNGHHATAEPGVQPVEWCRGDDIRSYHAETSFTQPDAILVSLVEGRRGMVITDVILTSTGTVRLALRVLTEGRRECDIATWQIGDRSQPTVCHHFVSGIPVAAGSAILAFVSSSAGHATSIMVSGYLF